MKVIFGLSCLLFCITNVFSQDSIVQYKFKYEGLDFKMDVPSDWYMENDGRLNIARQYIKDIDSFSNIGVMLLVLKIPYTPTQKEINELKAEEFFGQNSWGKIISSRKIMVDGLSSIEALTYNEVPLSIGDTYQCMLSYLMVYKNYFILLSYKSLSTISKEKSVSLFSEYETKFRSLTTGFILYNHWKKF